MKEEVVKRRLAIFKNPWLTLMHFHVTFIPCFFAVIGGLMANNIDLLRLVLGVLGIFIGKYGLYAYDEATGRQYATKIPKDTLIKAGTIFLAIGIAIGVYLSYLVPIFTIIFILISFLGFAYNYRKFANGLFHNFWNFSISWAMLPLIGGYVLMTSSIKPSIITMGIAVAFISSIIQRYSEIIKHAEDLNTVVYHSRQGQLAILYATLALMATFIFLYLGL